MNSKDHTPTGRKMWVSPRRSKLFSDLFRNSTFPVTLLLDTRVYLDLVGYLNKARSGKGFWVPLNPVDQAGVLTPEFAISDVTPVRLRFQTVTPRSPKPLTRAQSWGSGTAAAIGVKVRLVDCRTRLGDWSWESLKKETDEYPSVKDSELRVIALR